ncbi:MAG: glycosyltransferase [Aldersonia sp.]|nr:glycosyltransferase [Aldersonia sp.]
MTRGETESDVAFRDRALHDAVHGLRERDPNASAATAFVRWQVVALVGLLCVLIVGLVFATIPTLVALITVATLGYVLTVLDRVVLIARGLAVDAMVQVSDERARAIPDADLPPYTILLPAYDEPDVVRNLVRGMAALEYPRDKLQILLLLEADDEVTIAAIEHSDLVGALVTPLLVPPAEPRTKPKACNFGLHYATGEIVTIYDAEDTPDPLQLRRVVAAFSDLPDDVVCVQAKLGFFNGEQNLLTRWFAAEYGVMFNFLLPGLMNSKAVIPLGGTSNHIRRSLFDQIGAWDPFNVTEDADLGVRIFARGYRTVVLDSLTIEEANTDAINWMRQRSRWYKGYLQTWLVHMRNPLRLWRTLGPLAFLRFTVLLGGTPIVACLNIAFWGITAIWLLGRPSLVLELFPAWVYFPALLCLSVGNAITVYINLIGCRENHQTNYLFSCLTLPLYWGLMGIAAVKGCWQLLFRASYWEKTQHNLAEESP